MYLYATENVYRLLLELAAYLLHKFKTRWRQLFLHLPLGHFNHIEMMYFETETMYPRY